MKKSSLQKQALIAVLAVSAAAGWVLAQDSTSSSSRDPNQTPNTSANGKTEMSTEVRKVNKCSQLIGMEVKNQQGDRLGKINDVVIDFSNGKVAYVVLNSSSGPFTSEKLHAIPLQAFQCSMDGKSVTLNADKDKVASADGFSKDEWPSPSNPSWGAQPFWQNNNNNNSSDQQQQSPPNPQK